MDPAAAQAACGRLVAVDGPEECKAVVLACPGLVPFVVAALDKLGELCACLSGVPCQLSWQGPRGSVCLCSWILSLSWILLTLMAIHHVDSASSDICLHTYAQGTQVRLCSVRP